MNFCDYNYRGITMTMELVTVSQHILTMFSVQGNLCEFVS